MSSVSQPFTSEQLKLLIAFESATSLLELSEQLHKDQSVISRNLLSLSEIAPVIVKSNRKWSLTDLGRKVIEEARQFNEKVNLLLNIKSNTKANILKPDSVLLLINTQQALAENSQDTINNIKILLSFWRTNNLPVIFVRHESNKPESIFFNTKPGYNFISEIEPLKNELNFIKFKASALSSQKLLSLLNEKYCANIFLAGFTGSDCIEASARDLVENSFETYVVSDASSSLDILSADGKLHKAERVHALSMANINAYSAKVLKTQDLIHLQK